MKHPLTSVMPKRQEGSVAVEAALCMTFILVPLFYFVLLFGKYHWYYTAAQKAVHDAALYMATAPLSEIKGGGSVGLAMDIMVKETSDFSGDTTINPSILCSYRFPNSTFSFWAPCDNLNTPIAVQAAMSLNIVHPFFKPITSAVTGNDSINLWALSQMAYAGI